MAAHSVLLPMELIPKWEVSLPRSVPAWRYAAGLKAMAINP
jgi:hypothetical protein